jgi:hypothetical protein
MCSLLTIITLDSPEIAADIPPFNPDGGEPSTPGKFPFYAKDSAFARA